MDDPTYALRRKCSEVWRSWRLRDAAGEMPPGLLLALVQAGRLPAARALQLRREQLSLSSREEQCQLVAWLSLPEARAQFCSPAEEELRLALARRLLVLEGPGLFWGWISGLDLATRLRWHAALGELLPRALTAPWLTEARDPSAWLADTPSPSDPAPTQQSWAEALTERLLLVGALRSELPGPVIAALIHALTEAARHAPPHTAMLWAAARLLEGDARSAWLREALSHPAINETQRAELVGLTALAEGFGAGLARALAQPSLYARALSLSHLAAFVDELDDPGSQQTLCEAQLALLAAPAAQLGGPWRWQAFARPLPAQALALVLRALDQLSPEDQALALAHLVEHHPGPAFSRAWTIQKTLSTEEQALFRLRLWPYHYERDEEARSLLRVAEGGLLHGPSLAWERALRRWEETPAGVWCALAHGFPAEERGPLLDHALRALDGAHLYHLRDLFFPRGVRASGALVERLATLAQGAGAPRWWLLSSLADEAPAGRREAIVEEAAQRCDPALDPAHGPAPTWTEWIDDLLAVAEGERYDALLAAVRAAAAKAPPHEAAGYLFAASRGARPDDRRALLEEGFSLREQHGGGLGYTESALLHPEDPPALHQRAWALAKQFVPRPEIDYWPEILSHVAARAPAPLRDAWLPEVVESFAAQFAPPGQFDAPLEEVAPFLPRALAWRALAIAAAAPDGPEWEVSSWARHYLLARLAQLGEPPARLLAAAAETPYPPYRARALLSLALALPAEAREATGDAAFTAYESLPAEERGLDANTLTQLAQLASSAPGEGWLGRLFGLLVGDEEDPAGAHPNADFHEVFALLLPRGLAWCERWLVGLDRADPGDQAEARLCLARLLDPHQPEHAARLRHEAKARFLALPEEDQLDPRWLALGLPIDPAEALALPFRAAPRSFRAWFALLARAAPEAHAALCRAWLDQLSVPINWEEEPGFPLP